MEKRSARKLNFSTQILTALERSLERRAESFLIKKHGIFAGRPFVLAACLKNGDILLLRSYDDVIPQVSTAALSRSICCNEIPPHYRFFTLAFKVTLWTGPIVATF